MIFCWTNEMNCYKLWMFVKMFLFNQFYLMETLKNYVGERRHHVFGNFWSDTFGSTEYCYNITYFIGNFFSNIQCYHLHLQHFLHYYKILPWPGGRHLVGVFPRTPGYDATSLIDPVSVDWTRGSGTRSACALYQITVVYVDHHLLRVFPSATGYVVSSIWLYFISLVTVDWTGARGHAVLVNGSSLPTLTSTSHVIQRIQICTRDSHTSPIGTN